MTGISAVDFLADIPALAYETYAMLLLLMVVGYLTGDATRALLAGMIAVFLVPNPASLLIVVVITLLVHVVGVLREVLR